MADDQAATRPSEDARPSIEAWKERNLRRVDVLGVPVMVLGDDALVLIQTALQRFAEMKLALHRVSKMDQSAQGAGNIAREALHDNDAARLLDLQAEETRGAARRLDRAAAATWEEVRRIQRQADDIRAEANHGRR